jgi:hypothetical protein
VKAATAGAVAAFLRLFLVYQVGRGDYARFSKYISSVFIGGFASLGRFGGLTGLRGSLWRLEGKQFGRYACGFTPAFGRAEASATRLVYLGLRPRLVYIGPLALRSELESPLALGSELEAPWPFAASSKHRWSLGSELEAPLTLRSELESQLTLRSELEARLALGSELEAPLVPSQ